MASAASLMALDVWRAISLICVMALLTSSLAADCCSLAAAMALT